MGLQFTPISIVLFISSGISLYIFYYVHKYRSATGRYEFMAFMLSSFIWSFAYGMELSFKSMDSKLFWFACQSIGIVTAPVNLYMFSIKYSGVKIFQKSDWAATLFILPFLTYSAIITNRYHHLYFLDIQLRDNGYYIDMFVTFGPVFWIQVIYSYALIILASYNFFKAFRQGAYLHQRQAGALLVTSILPLFGNLPTVLGANPYNLELLPFIFTLTGIIIIIGLFHYNLLDVIPVARSKIVEELDEMVLVLDSAKRLIDFNQVAGENFSLKANLIGKDYQIAFAQWPDFIKCLKKNRFKNFIAECHIKNSESDSHYYDIKVSEIHDQPTKVNAFVLVMHDVTKRKKESQKMYITQNELKTIVKTKTIDLENALKEKEVLLKEVHHRVKNNMQLVSSLLSIQANTITDPIALNAFEESKNRIRSMALVHESLYKSENLAKIPFQNYVNTLAQNLFMNLNTDPQRIQLNVNIADIELEIENAIPCGLLINEMLSNSLKHAFPDARKGKINISFKKTDGHYTLIYHDNGIGLPADFDISQSKTLGLELISSLSKQLSSELDISSNSGTSYTLTFEE